MTTEEFAEFVPSLQKAAHLRWESDALPLYKKDPNFAAWEFVLPILRDAFVVGYLAAAADVQCAYDLLVAPKGSTPEA